MTASMTPRHRAVTLLATRVLVSTKGFVLWLRQAQERFTPAPVGVALICADPALRNCGFQDFRFDAFAPSLRASSSGVTRSM